MLGIVFWWISNFLEISGVYNQFKISTFLYSLCLLKAPISYNKQRPSWNLIDSWNLSKNIILSMYITLNTGQKVTEVYDLSKMSVVEKNWKRKFQTLQN